MALNAQVTRLSAALRARDEQIRILQCSLDYSVRAALDGSGSDPPVATSIAINGPATLEYLRDIKNTQASAGAGMTLLTDMYAGFSYTSSPDTGTGTCTGTEADAASAASDAASDCEAGLVDLDDADNDFDIDSSSEAGSSFFEVSTPTPCPCPSPSDLHPFGSPRSGSPGPPSLSSDTSIASSDDWSDVGDVTDTDTDIDTDMEVPSPSSSGGMMPARAESPLRADADRAVEGLIGQPSMDEINLKTTSPPDFELVENPAPALPTATSSPNRRPPMRSTMSGDSTSRPERYSVLSSQAPAMNLKPLEGRALAIAQRVHFMKNGPIATDESLNSAVSLVPHEDRDGERKTSILNDDSFVTVGYDA